MKRESAQTRTGVKWDECQSFSRTIAVQPAELPDKWLPVVPAELTPALTAWTCHLTHPSHCCTRRCWLLWRRPAPLDWSNTSTPRPDWRRGMIPFKTLDSRLFINKFNFITEAETSGTTKLHWGKVSFVLHLHVIGTCAVTHAFTHPWCENRGPHTAFGTRPATFVDADLFHHFSLRRSNSLPSPTVELAFFNATLDGPQEDFLPNYSFSEALIEAQHPLVAYCGDCITERNIWWSFTVNVDTSEEM